jgi:hypothetical protein
MVLGGARMHDKEEALRNAGLFLRPAAHALFMLRKAG